MAGTIKVKENEMTNGEEFIWLGGAMRMQTVANGGTAELTVDTGVGYGVVATYDADDYDKFDLDYSTKCKVTITGDARVSVR